MSKENNFQQKIVENSYPGRGLLMGLLEDQETVAQLYWIMGRSSNSRNRVFKATGAKLETEAADPSKLEDPSLVIYEAMLENNNSYIVSNGDQTRTVYQSLVAGQTFESALISRDREPDAPNYTPRITGQIDINSEQPFYKYAILKANQAMPELSDRNFYYKEAIAPGSAFALTTYESDGSPLPSFYGEPVELPFSGSAAEILEKYWEAVDAENKVSMAIKSISLKTGNSEILLKNKN